MMKFVSIANLSVSPRYFRWLFESPASFEDWVKDREWVWDADNCGDDTSYWVVMKEKPVFYRVKHSWWWQEYGDDPGLQNEFEVTEVPSAALDQYAKECLKFVV